MRVFLVKGMSCAACSARVESAVSKLSGVDSCAVSLLTNSMTVSGDAADEEIILAVEKAGYAAVRKSEKAVEALLSDGSEALLSRLKISLGFLILLMYFSMGVATWRFPIPAFLSERPFLIGLLQFLLSGVILAVNRGFFASGVRGALHGGANMDTLVSLGSGVSFVYSTVTLCRMLGQNPEEQRASLQSLWFESAAMILVLITLGKFLEARAKGKTTSAIRSLLDLSPKTATVRREGKEITIPADELLAGDVFLVRTGERIPADGRVLSGSGTTDESALTGESLPQEKERESKVFTATVCLSGYLECEAVKVGGDTVISEVVRTVERASSGKAPVAKIADRVASVFVPAVIAVSLVTLGVWLLTGAAFGYALTRAVSVLVISCPCALGLATPVAVTVGSGVGAENGILYKTALSLELSGRIETVVLDKTGTVTEGKMTIADLLPAEGVSEDKLLTLAASLEEKSEHPLARAIAAYAVSRVSLLPSADFEQGAGGVCAKIDGKTVYGGNLRYLSEKTASVPDGTKDLCKKLAEDGKTPLVFLSGGEILGVIALSDRIKKDSKRAVSDLHAMGIRTVMLSGDSEACAKAVAKEVGIDEVIAGVLPAEKANRIAELSKSEKVAMIGDGINDAPALTVADVGIAIGAGTDVAMESADIVLMRSGLSDAVSAVKIGRATLKNVRENLFWAFFYNLIGIPLAAGVFIPLFGWELVPMFGAAAMSLSSVTVVCNALRLNLLKFPPKKNLPFEEEKIEKTEISNETEDEKMTKTMRIEGMMCPHCEARVKKCLEAVDGVLSAEVSHERGCAVLTLSKEVDDGVLKAVVQEQGYTVK